MIYPEVEPYAYTRLTPLCCTNISKACILHNMCFQKLSHARIQTWHKLKRGVYTYSFSFGIHALRASFTLWWRHQMETFSPVNFPHKGQWRGALMFSLIYAWTNDWVNNREAGDLRRQHGHYDVIAMPGQRLAGTKEVPLWVPAGGRKLLLYDIHGERMGSQQLNTHRS